MSCGTDIDLRSASTYVVLTSALTRYVLSAAGENGLLLTIPVADATAAAEAFNRIAVVSDAAADAVTVTADKIG